MYEFLTDDVSGYDQLWFIGDTFVATSFRQHFKKEREYSFFCKDHFDISAYCGSRQSEKDQNIVRRIKNSLIAGLNKHWKMPKYIVVVLDSDVIDFVDYKNFGISTMYGDLLESIIKGVVDIIDDRKKKLPAKAVKGEYPFIYWMCLPKHKNLDFNSRSKFNLTLESIIKLYPNMRVAQIKDNWDINDENLAQSGRLTGLGFNRYWQAIDASLRFNVSKRERILDKSSMKKSGTSKDASSKQQSKRGNRSDGIPAFFSKYRKTTSGGKGVRLPEP